MKPVRIFRHVACEGPGYLGTFLEQHNIPYEVICIDEGVTVPQNLEDISGLIFMGGGMNVTDPLQWISDEKKLIKKAINQNIPVLGICLGAQLMSTALGGEITHDPNMEIGWHAVVKDTENQNSEWLKNLPENFIPFHWHADTFSIPDEATVLLHSKCRINQAFAIKNSLAIQFHVEMTVEMVKQWSHLFKSDLENQHPCTQKKEELIVNLEERIAALHQCADIFFGKWIKNLK
ncbi:MAG: type 1 glutamine amidotransferase [Gammaproteobacteria bacterium]|nr:type 1 glutamine amidotransferase [Gammaproteobacteria bacterium]MCW8987407.1 type 1 glutamine amidotransferase [Gammaproteobacteria bacterium]